MQEELLWNARARLSALAGRPTRLSSVPILRYGRQPVASEAGMPRLTPAAAVGSHRKGRQKLMIGLTSIQELRMPAPWVGRCLCSSSHAACGWPNMRVSGFEREIALESNRTQSGIIRAEQIRHAPEPSKFPECWCMFYGLACAPQSCLRLHPRSLRIRAD